MEMMDKMNWESIPSTAEYEKELRKIRRNLGKRNVLLVLTSLFLASVLLFCSVRYGIPALESRYWNPRTVSYRTENGTDLDMVLAAYADLFSPNTRIEGTRINKTGFASYSVTIQYYDENEKENRESYAILDKGELFIPHGIWESISFSYVGNYWTEYMSTLPGAIDQQNRINLEKLAPLPDYVQVAAYITFTEDKTLAEVFQFREELTNASNDWYNDTGYCWTAIRHCDEVDNSVRCGFTSGSYTDQFPEANEQYPAFSEWQAYADRNVGYEQIQTKAETYAAHFKSLLNYMDDQLKAGTGIPAPASGTGVVDMDYYANALAYVEEHGVMSYGCYVIASPSHLLEIMERDDVLIVFPTEVWLSM